MATNLTPSEQARFDAKWRKIADCHVWTQTLDRDGYGMFYLRRKNRRAARVAWYAKHGPIPAGLVVNHACRNHACVNVQHLRLLSPSENTLIDSSSLAYVNSRKTHCPRGHEYDRTVTTAKRAYRSCSICENAKQRRLRAKWAHEDTLSV